MKYPHQIIALISLFACLTPLHAAELPSDVYPGLRGPDGKLLPSVAGHLGRDLRIVDRKLDPEMLERRNNFGYSDEEMHKYFSAPIRMVLDETGLDRSFITPVPPAGVHPRVIFNASDLPGIRRRLETTEAGRAAIKGIREHLVKMITGPNAQFGDQYQSLVAGTLPDPLDNNVVYCLMYESFRCLVDKDESAGRKVAAAIATFSEITRKEIAVNLANPRNASALNDARIITQGPSREFTLGLGYDFAYNFMTKAQRDKTRKALVETTAGMTGIGCETLGTLHTGTSNWISWGARALFAICAIEGEPGYDPATFRRFADAQINFINSIYPTGEAFEGWGKNFMFLEHLVILAKRGEKLNILGHTSIRAAYNDYFVASMTPWGDSFTFCDSMARSGGKIARNADVLMYRSLFPKDVAGNLIYRNQIAGDYSNVGSRTINTRHPFSTMDALCCAIFANDVAPVDRDAEFAALTGDRPQTYFSEDTCNLITRSSWEPDSLYLNYLNRAIPGGHQYADRSHFNLYGNGRFWSIYQSSRQIKQQYGPIMRSVVMADGEGPSTAEGRCVAMADTPLATFIATDLSNSWNFQTAGFTPPPADTPRQGKTHSYNHFRLRSSPLPWMDLPISHLPDWYSSEKPDAAKPAFGNNSRGDWYRRHDVRKAFRTIGLVRGKHPYTLVVDDIRIDDRRRNYVWGMTLAPDVVLGSVRVTSAMPDAAEAEIVLTESETPDLSNARPSEKRRHLLVRVLDASHLAETPAVVERVAVPNPPQPDVSLNRFHLMSQAVSPGFKILLFPHVEGQSLPVTKWNETRDVLTVSWQDQTDVIRTTTGEDGRTRLEIRRDGWQPVETP
jgi:hypothetical protein